LHESSYEILTSVQQYGYLYYMKATIDIPDDLYRRVKAKSAMESRTVREVTVALYRTWIEGAAAVPAEARPVTSTARPSWFGGAKSYAERKDRHDMEAIRESISKGRRAARNGS